MALPHRATAGHLDQAAIRSAAADLGTRQSPPPRVVGTAALLGDVMPVRCRDAAVLDLMLTAGAKVIRYEFGAIGANDAQDAFGPTPDP